MTNEEKANEISERRKDKHCVEYHCYRAAIEMAEWKDKEWAERFKKVLDYAEICYGVFSFEQRKNFINHIKEIFYGKE